MSEFTNVVYIPYWLLILLIFLSSGALQYVLIGAVRLVIRTRERKQTHTTEKPALQVIHLEAARISDEDLRERTEGLR